tara:strand:+ start:18000 stop:18131 length:132 start_codon:yes stop_codon:yes gene_type:complete
MEVGITVTVFAIIGSIAVIAVSVATEVVFEAYAAYREFKKEWK